MPNLVWGKGFLKTLVASALYAIVHSLLASRTAKRTARNLLGGRVRNALYRPFYLLQSAVTMALLVGYIRRQPAELLFHFSGVSAVPFRLVQAGSLCWASWAAYEVGLSGILGVRPLVELALAKDEILPEPEAQGPSFHLHNRVMQVEGPFLFTRHPLNLAPLGVMWFNPRMTTNLLAFNLLSTFYLVLGSRLEELRLSRAYGAAYRDYQASGVPFFLPGTNRSA